MDFRVPILTYHKIAPVDPGTIYPGTFVPPRLFERHIAYLARKSYRTARLENVFSEPTTDKRIILTFDDGFQDFAENAFPTLKHHGFDSTVFLVADHLGGLNEWDIKVGDSPASLMSIKTVQDLQHSGVEFGSHTLTHAHLDRVGDQEQRREVIQSKHKLESVLGFPITTFCFPYGGYNDFTLKCVEEAGYKIATSTDKGINEPKTDIRRLKRIAIRNDTSLPVFIYKLWRAYKLGK